MENWHTFAERLRWAIDEQPREGRRRGLRLFVKRMEGVQGASLSQVQAYLRGQTEPSLPFVQAAAHMLGVRAAWLAFGSGAPVLTEAADDAEVLALRFATAALFRELGKGPEVVRNVKAGFSAPYAPSLHRLAMRTMDARHSWAGDVQFMIEKRQPGWALSVDDDRLEEARRIIAAAIVAPFDLIGIPKEEVIPVSGQFVQFVELMSAAINQLLTMYNDHLQLRADAEEWLRRNPSEQEEGENV